MKTKSALILAALFLGPALAVAELDASDASPPQVDFSTPRDPATKHYRFVTDYLTYAPNGARTGTEQARMECLVTVDESGGQDLECLRFDLVGPAGTALEIPKLRGWKNRIDPKAAEVLGVTQADFQGLTTEDGAPLAPELSYRVYNTFVDFYAFNNVFGQPAPDGGGTSIADLNFEGQEIEHYSAYSEPPVDLGDSVKKGSYFKNGRVTLQWLGMGRVGKQDCAIVQFDSGESSFQMLLEPVPDTPMQVKGGSHYWGDLFVNLEDYWLEQATFKEFVMTEIVFGQNPPAPMLVKRLGKISLVR